MKSYTGDSMTISKEAIYATSIRQQLSTKYSTKPELVSVDDILPQIL